MKHLHLLFAAILGCLMMQTLNSCTEIEVCEEGEHPHRTGVNFRYNWRNYGGKCPVDSMYIVSYRVVNLWKSAMYISGSTGKGYYLYNPHMIAVKRPSSGSGGSGQSGETPEHSGSSSEELARLITDFDGSETTSVTRSDEYDYVSAMDHLLDTFRLPKGDYKFVTFSYNPGEFDYSSVEKYLADATVPLHDLKIKYRLFERSDSALEVVIPGWTDYNVYNGTKCYMQPHLHTLCYDTLPTRTLKPNAHNRLTFAPRPLTQHIDVYFDIKKNLEKNLGFTVDSVFAELSGIPTTIELASSYLDITHTAKTMFKMEYTKDQPMNTKVACHTGIDVPTVIQNSSDSLYFGPGIMQVVIFTRTTYLNPYTNQPETAKKSFQGCINLYNTLEKANLIKYTNDGKHVLRNGDKKELRIKAELIIDGEKIIKNADDNGGLDIWQHMDDQIFIDI